MKPPPLLVVGFGNPLRGDDAAGLLVAEWLRAKLPAATVLELETVPLDLYTFWTPETAVVLIDAAHSGAKPGTVHRFDAHESPLPADVLRVSTHTGGLATAAELARALSYLPISLVVYAIEGRTFEPGARVSQAVACAIVDVASRVTREEGRSYA